MNMSTYKVLLFPVLFVATVANAGVFGPVDACTFHKNPWKSTWNQCAEFKVERGGGCKKKKWWGRYNGDKLTMYLPDFFIEATPHFGKSKFTESRTNWFPLKKQLEWARSVWSGTWADNPLLTGGKMPKRSQMYHVRIITIANGGFHLAYPWFKSISTAIPLCFSAISEFFPAQWKNNLVDGPYALATNSVAVPLCESPAAAVGDLALSGLDDVISRIGFGANPPPLPADPSCSFPAPLGLIQLGLANPLSDAYRPLRNPLELCIGTLGPKFPRTGMQNIEDPYMAALSAILKFSSLAGDTYMRPEYKIEPDDKLQMVYPKPAVGAPTCFRPGRDLRFDGGSFDANTLSGLIDRGSSSLFNRAVETPKNSDSYIFAVWKKRSHCEEPFGKQFFKHIYSTNTSIHRTTCGGGR